MQSRMDDPDGEEITMNKKITTVVAVSAALVLALAGCSTGTTDGGNSTPETTPLTSGVDKAAAAALPASIRDSGVVRVAVGIPYPPFILRGDDGKLEGLDVDMSQALGEKLGLDFKLSHQAFETVIPSLQADKFNIIMEGMNDTVERQKTLNFIDYLYSGFTIVVKKGNPENIGTLLDLCGRSVAVQKSTVQGQILRDQVTECEAEGRGGIDVQELPVANDAQTALKAGRVQAYVVDAPVAAYTIATAGDGNDFEGVTDPKNPQGFAPVYTGIALLKDQTELTDALELALQSLIDEGVYQEILDEHGMGSAAVQEATVNGTKP